MKKSLVFIILLMLIFSNVSFANIVKKYYPNGKVSSVQIYTDKGFHEGPDKTYWPNGKLKQEILYKHGRPFRIKNWSEKGVRLRK
jgi:antitoxin component YwqK of YwqJK toxin-antitoxin module